jgi:hypothetical protein
LSVLSAAAAVLAAGVVFTTAAKLGDGDAAPGADPA